MCCVRILSIVDCAILKLDAIWKLDAPPLFLMRVDNMRDNHEHVHVLDTLVKYVADEDDLH